MVKNIEIDFTDFRILVDDNWPIKVIYEIGGQILRSRLRLSRRPEEELRVFFNEITHIEIKEDEAGQNKRITIIFI